MRRILRKIAAGDVTARAREYVETMVWQWGLTGAVVALSLMALTERSGHSPATVGALAILCQDG